MTSSTIEKKNKDQTLTEARRRFKIFINLLLNCNISIRTGVNCLFFFNQCKSIRNKKKVLKVQEYSYVLIHTTKRFKSKKILINKDYMFPKQGTCRSFILKIRTFALLRALLLNLFKMLKPRDLLLRSFLNRDLNICVRVRTLHHLSLKIICFFDNKKALTGFFKNFLEIIKKDLTSLSLADRQINTRNETEKSNNNINNNNELKNKKSNV
ncbi:hypothetical protein CVS40_4298 [Lucilia cuprina]|nr:hypothetical protein CVS40_4298 [Lucilia cuprina]